MNSKDRAIAELKELISQQRAKIAPDVLARAQKVAEASTSAAKTVPYDHKAAQKAIGLFLQTHPDQKSFTTRLLSLMEKTKA